MKLTSCTYYHISKIYVHYSTAVLESIFLQTIQTKFLPKQLLNISFLFDVIRYSANRRGPALFQTSRSLPHICNVSLIECDKVIWNQTLIKMPDHILRILLLEQTFLCYESFHKTDYLKGCTFFYPNTQKWTAETFLICELISPRKPVCDC